MNYNFDELIDRTNTDSFKWDKYKNRDIIPLWVADMDFKAAPPILEALEKVTKQGVIGYWQTPEELVDVVVKRLKERHNWEIQKEWIVWLPGLVPGLTLSCMVVGDEGDEIMTTVPVYGPFMKAPEAAKKKLVKVQMKLEGNRWTLDFDAIRAAITPRTKMFMLCNPYNPAGTVFTKEELQTLADICAEHNIVICSDEIHCDLILDETKKHISIATLSQEIANRTITLLSPSKTFNIAGLGCSFAVIPDDATRAKYANLRYIVEPMISAYAYQAALTAYRDCDDWLQELLTYLRKNHDFVLKEVNAIKGLSMQPLEATYLAWIDTRELGIDNIAEVLENAGVGISEGGFYFDGKGFIRLNFGTQMQRLEAAFERIRKVFN
ncbi:aminotransferase class I and II [Emticicia oligotrophica DSM 17448]|uniref:cysteine-S-conjugate beta-lyase n=1 Tax=Emticicia oligotrophica (strain DSM 17448 / CIP 109782 / MTCC 6937 / GPTSA100-15) TaxID=929562 RepID=A0ABM5MYA7_EMTOG|nr:PatB family C-S lyase [Emticicia oligotrophica]AFK02130.1 aminotransferase class I and II [Emticicia oligotrophica DSM 17448]